MERPIIEVHSVTYAMKGREILKKHSIKGDVIKITHLGSNGGCGYGISVYPRDAVRARKILHEHGIKTTSGKDRRGTDDIS